MPAKIGIQRPNKDQGLPFTDTSDRQSYWSKLYVALGLPQESVPKRFSYDYSFEKVSEENLKRFVDSYKGLTLDRVAKGQKSPPDFKEFITAHNDRYGSLGKKFAEKQPEFMKLLEKNWNTVRTILAKAWNVSGSKKKDIRLVVEKEALRVGLHPDDYEAALHWIVYYTSMSHRKIPDEVVPVIQKMTVRASQIPKKIYRGLFIDGAKVKDREAFLQKNQPGKKASFKMARTSSWTTDYGTAATFMTSDDRVKDTGAGFAMIVSYEPKPEEIVADLRHLNFLRFWNQQEIIMIPGLKGMTVEKITDEKDARDHASSNRRALSGNHGISMVRTMSDYFGYLMNPKQLQHFMSGIDIKKYKDSTIKDFIKAERIKSELTLREPYDQIKIPLIAFVGNDGIDEVISSEEILLRTAFTSESVKIMLRAAEVPFSDQESWDFFRKFSWTGRVKLLPGGGAYKIPLSIEVLDLSVAYGLGQSVLLSNPTIEKQISAKDLEKIRAIKKQVTKEIIMDSKKAAKAFSLKWDFSKLF